MWLSSFTNLDLHRSTLLFVFVVELGSCKVDEVDKTNLGFITFLGWVRHWKIVLSILYYNIIILCERVRGHPRKTKCYSALTILMADQHLILNQQYQKDLMKPEKITIEISS